MPQDGYKNIDRSPEARADEFYDINEGIREADESIDEINAGCVLEQVDDLMFVLNECWRVLKHNGHLTGYVPSIDPRVLHLDPADKRFFQEGSFDYFNKNKHHWREFGRIYGYKGWTAAIAQTNDNGIINFEMIK